jgi:hypothetical protein
MAGGVNCAAVTISQGMSLKQTYRAMNQQRRIRRMRRVVIASSENCRDVGERAGSRYETLLVTLTYRPGAKWDQKHISAYIGAVNKHLSVAGIRGRYQWVIELTKAGIPHYHVLWWLPPGERLPMPDKSGMWTHGLSRVERARNAVGYLVKYATKGETEVYSLPKGCRLFGVGGGLAEERLATHRAGLPMWLLECISDDARGRRVARVGWVDCSTGEIHQTPFNVVVARDDWGIVQITITRRENVQ